MLSFYLLLCLYYCSKYKSRDSLAHDGDCTSSNNTVLLSFSDSVHPPVFSPVSPTISEVTVLREQTKVKLELQCQNKILNKLLLIITKYTICFKLHHSH